MTDVVAALIWDGDRFLACQRPAAKARGLLWEFVGGKVEAGETKQQALIRECKEELGILVTVQEEFMEVIHEYPDLTVRLTLYNAVIADGVPQKLEHNDIRWITPKQIDAYSFCPADEEILRRLKAVSNGLEARLFSLQDENYRQFQSKLIPTVPFERIIGVRTPDLRGLGKRIEKSDTAQDLLQHLPHRYYEQDNLHALLINDIRSYEQTITALDSFLPYVDNWATCDLLSPVSFKKRPAPLPQQIQKWLGSDLLYTVRFGIGMLLKFYLDDGFEEKYLSWVANVKSNEYYINMMIAWYFATALAKQYDKALVYLKDGVLDRWTHNKTIQKAVESYRIDEEQKRYLRSLKR